jgi:hypothetical protein
MPEFVRQLVTRWRLEAWFELDAHANTPGFAAGGGREPRGRKWTERDR